MRLTYSPLPKFRHFLSMFTQPKSDNILSDPWCTSNDKFRWFSCSAHSLFALTALKCRTTSTRNIIIWVPDFFCNSSLEPVRKLNSHIVFYPIHKDFNPDFEWCNKNCMIQKPDIFLLVHYFGIPINSFASKKFCEKNDTWLVEDAAHCFLPIEGIGNNGDFVLYSPHKHMAIMDGAILVIKQNGQRKLENLGIKESDFSFRSDGRIYRDEAGIIFITIWLFKRFFQKIGIRKKNTNYVFWPEVENLGASFKHREMSKISKIFLSEQLSNLNEFVLKRREHYKLWKNELLINKFNKSEQLQKNIIPYFAPFELINEAEIDNLYKRLKQAGIPVTTWPDLPAEVISDSAKHISAIHLRKSRIYIHVHQSLSSKKIIEICKHLVL